MDLGSFFTSLYASEIGPLVIVGRLVLAAGLAAVLGFDRAIRVRAAGMRTYMLVSLAAATFTVVTFELIEQAKAEGSSSVDPIRIIEAVTAGVAFLAAGAIIQARGKIHGVMTGAGLWLAGAVGTAAGIGAYPIAILATVFGFVILTLFHTATDAIPQKAEPPTGQADD